jgi:Mg-chelatase subunit ChlD
MPVGIPGGGSHRYRAGDSSSAREAIATAADALRAFADDLLESGDARLTLDRAFRWGYRDEAGNHVAGLQEQRQDLRHQRDRLLRQIDHADFLDAITPELDRLDALDGREGTDEQAPVDRLLDRLEHGYEAEEAQADLDALRHELAASLGEQRGPGRAGSGRAGLQDARSARSDRLRRMLFSGGGEGAAGGGAWTRDATERAVAAARFDLSLLAELERVEAALTTLDTVGSVAALPEETMQALHAAGMGDLAGWLGAWSEAAGATLGSDAPALRPEVVAAISRDLLKGLFRAAASPLRGDHTAMATGTAGEPSESTAPWEPGRPLDLDLVATVSSAVRRGGASGGKVRLAPDDFAVIERGSSVAVSTVMAIDRSRSMGQSGGWVAARKVALAMHELIRQAYPRDSLDVIAFSSTAERVAIADVPTMPWDRFEHGTHLQSALSLARRLLRRARSGTRQVVVITDGEPTLATVRGVEVFASPPSPEVLEATMTEVVRCTREGITINLVMLGGEGRSDFAAQVARVNHGRVFRATSETLGAWAIREYVSR